MTRAADREIEQRYLWLAAFLILCGAAILYADYYGDSVVNSVTDIRNIKAGSGDLSGFDLVRMPESAPQWSAHAQP
jgi:hypothetical protein